jgi:hypothetical protein
MQGIWKAQLYIDIGIGTVLVFIRPISAVRPIHIMICSSFLASSVKDLCNVNEIKLNSNKFK